MATNNQSVDPQLFQLLRDEIGRLQARCSSLQTDAALEGARVINDITRFAQDKAKDGKIGLPLLLKFLALLSTNSGRHSTHTPHETGYKRSRSSNHMGEDSSSNSGSDDEPTASVPQFKRAHFNPPNTNAFNWPATPGASLIELGAGFSQSSSSSSANTPNPNANANPAVPPLNLPPYACNYSALRPQKRMREDMEDDEDVEDLHSNKYTRFDENPFSEFPTPNICGTTKA
eukprot:TRINITY_DN66948_c10_g9_i1.p1 TRINITY_DN66948_c10_g9~~TRINITY_DN66948_c10_g9_i1.p1  ORF type:complete len:231 (+),score=25.81 TRINITY_DN66948_c10_g9_i1:68-760(+)